jgi:predicted transcriptional regulator
LVRKKIVSTFAVPFELILHLNVLKLKRMKIREVVDLLNAKVVSGHHHLDAEVEFTFASDLMSDVLTVEKDNMLLLTGLANLQTIRTAEMSEITNIIFVRRKKATPDMLQLAEENDMILVECDYSMFKASGLLFSAGLKPVY